MHLCVKILWCCKNTACGFDARGCDTLGCIATQPPVGFLVEL